MEPPTEPDHYLVLGINQDATRAHIRQAYLKLSLKYHPDKAKSNGAAADATKFRMVKEAYDILSSDRLRTNYDMKYPGISTAWRLYNIWHRSRISAQAQSDRGRDGPPNTSSTSEPRPHYADPKPAQHTPHFTYPSNHPHYYTFSHHANPLGTGFTNPPSNPFKQHPGFTYPANPSPSPFYAAYHSSAPPQKKSAFQSAFERTIPNPSMNARTQYSFLARPSWPDGVAGLQVGGSRGGTGEEQRRSAEGGKGNENVGRGSGEL
ncbi:hypothetical protein LTS18_011076 [Coniosporium uncinatum]|uniref:Uncharacterized protein n=1 Tax=Coniosporium uncinatum TaxID=93489 RepID=A0ACC3DWD5_9PEZI|nr:hypothetical protein LTS18_011076 [Coniosporium uncinatum]